MASPNLEDLFRDAEPDLTVGERIEVERQRLATVEKSSKYRTRTLAMIVMAMILMTSILGLNFLIKHRDGRTPTLVSFHSDPIEIHDTYRLTRIKMTLPGDISVRAHVFDFDNNRFLLGQTIVDNSDVFYKAFQQPPLKEDIVDSWIVIIAGASIDGDSEKNLQICRRRVKRTAELIQSMGQLKIRAMWGIPMGRFQPTDKKGKAVSGMGAKHASIAMEDYELKDQRTLILISIRLVGNVGKDHSDEVVYSTVAMLRSKSLIPTNYDYGESSPSVIELSGEFKR